MLKLIAFSAALLVSYGLVSAALYTVGVTVQLVGAGSSSSPNPYVVLFGDAVTILCVLSVSVFFTVPAVLAMYGHAGAWVRHVVVRSAKGLSVAFGASLLLYLGGSAASAVEVGVDAASTAEAIAVLGLSGFLVVGLLSREAFLRGVEGLVEISLSILSAFLSSNGRKSIVAVEMQLTPVRQVRDKWDQSVMQEQGLKFQRLARSLTTVARTAEFKLSFTGRRGRILLLAESRGGDDLGQRLLSVARTYLPDSRPALVDYHADTVSNPSTVLLSGAPEATANPLEPLARFFLENDFEGDYAVILQRRRGNPISKILARREQRRLAEASGGQKTSSSITGEQTSTSVQDHLVQIGLEEAVKKVERRDSSQAVSVWVYLTGRGRSRSEAEQVAKTAGDVVRSTLSSHRRNQEIKVRQLRGQFVDLAPRGKATVVLPSEVALLLWVPQMAIGMPVAPSVEFELPPALEGEIELGEVMLQSGPGGHLAKIPLDTLTKHVFVTGLTGSGKTTSCFNLLLQLYRLGVPFVVIEPVKRDYRTLISVIPSLQVFTLGDDQTAPFRLNIFEPPSGVKVQTHLENLAAAWNGSFVMYSPLPYVVRQVLVETYKVCGWDISKDKRGRPITLDDFEFQAEKVSRSLGYERNVTMDIEAALKARIFSLTLGGKGALFNTVASIPTEEILRLPTVIELQDIPDNEEKAFVAALILMNLMEYIETKGRSKQLRHLTLVEEAHRLLPNVSTQKGDPESADPRRRMVEQFANMLAEVRAYGEGLAIVEQIPTKIIPDAIKNTATKIAHRTPAADDRGVLAGAMNLTEEQAPAFSELQPGEAIISVERHPIPIKIQVPNTIDKIGLPFGEIGNDEVKRHMTEFYLRNPLPRAPPSPLVADLLLIVESRWFKAAFEKAYWHWLATGAKEPLANLLVQSARKKAKSEEDVFPFASRILSLAAERYLFFDEEKNEFPDVFMRSVERSMRDDKGVR